MLAELLKSAEDLTDKNAAAAEVVAALNAEITSYQRTQPAVALEAIFARDDVLQIAGLAPVQGAIEARTIWSQELKLGPLMEGLPAAEVASRIGKQVAAVYMARANVQKMLQEEVAILEAARAANGGGGCASS